MTLTDEQLLRYSRQIMLPQVDITGQEQLLASRVLIIGLGGLGAPVALYLAASGIGELTLVDFDDVDLSNLQRQIIHYTRDIGRPKVESAREQLNAINPECRIRTLNHKLKEDELRAQVEQHDVVVDCSDNFDTRFAINRACVTTGTPLVSGAVIRMEGQVSVFLPEQTDSPCYACLYREEGEDETRCSETGVLAPVVGIIGSIQATETIKVLTGLPSIEGRLLLLDAERMQFREMRLKKDPHCPVCTRHRS
jgi:adenylyltransferase/sulfurtransferase